MVIELNTRQCEMIRRLVEREIDELGPEIHHTMTRDFKDELKQERHAYQEILHILEPVVPMVESL